MYKIMVYCDNDIPVHESYCRSGDMTQSVLSTMKANLRIAYSELYPGVPVSVTIEEESNEKNLDNLSDDCDLDWLFDRCCQMAT